MNNTIKYNTNDINYYYYYYSVGVKDNDYYLASMVTFSTHVVRGVGGVGRSEKNQRFLQSMFQRAVNSPSPIGILKTADSLWKTSKQRPFFGHSYTSPTPSIFTIQKLGLGVTKAFAVHIRNATRKPGTTYTSSLLNSQTALDSINAT